MNENNGLSIFEDYLFLKKAKVYHKVKIADIALIKANSNYCETMTVEGENFVTRTTIGKFEKLLSSHPFLRVHRQYIIHLGHLEQINFQEGHLSVRQEQVPISRPKRKELETMIQKLD